MSIVISVRKVSARFRFASSRYDLLRKSRPESPCTRAGKPASCSTFLSAAFLFLFNRLSPRPISNSQLHMLPCFHLCPIYLVVFKGSYFLMKGISHLEGGFTLRCLQRLSLPDLATLPCRWSTADTPVVRPSRSSRTKDSSSQISSARAG